MNNRLPSYSLLYPVRIGLILLGVFFLTGCTQGCYVDLNDLAESHFTPVDVDEIEYNSYESSDTMEGKNGPYIRRLLGSNRDAYDIVQAFDTYLREHGWEAGESSPNDKSFGWGYSQPGVSIGILIADPTIEYINLAPTYQTALVVYISQRWNDESCP